MTGSSTEPDLTVPDLTPPDLTAPQLTVTGPSAAALDGHPDTDNAGYLVRSEEHLRVSTVQVRARRVRLEKFVVTETRTITVQVSREEVRLVDVDLGDDPTDELTPVAAGDDGRWLTLSEERVAITTEVVPVERVRLGVYAVTEQHDITDTVRHEQVQLDQLPGGHSDPHSHY